MSVVTAGQVWKRRGGNARYRIYSVRQGRFNLLDEAEGYGKAGETFTRVIAEPLHGGRPVAATLTAFEDRYELAQGEERDG